MCKVFVEYAIKAEFREPFLIYMRQWQQREGRLELLEGTDQAGLFVEIWQDVTYDDYAVLKKERLQPPAGRPQELAPWENWISGGITKLHMWHFTPVGK